MTKYTAILTALLLPPLAALHAADEPAKKPNIIVILVDDMGFSDIGCYGSEIPTPHLDSLAAGGLRFTQFYNTGRCCPTRASLLTGLYPHQAGVGLMTEDSGVPGYTGRLNDSCVTIAEVLRPAGYFTAMTGKWHVGQNHGVTPGKRGFDRSLNAPAGGFFFADGDKNKAQLFLNGELLDNHDPKLPPNWYSTDLWTTFGLKFVDEALAAKKPFYLHLCHNAPHFPLQAPAEDIARFRGKYQIGWEATQAQRYARMIGMGIIDPKWPKAPRPGAVTPWADVPQEEKDRFDHIMAVYAATVYRMDKAIGDLISGLKQRGVFENTLILFMSDNGGNAEAGPKGRSLGDPTKGQSTWFCGESWAFAQNTPFRFYKHYNHEGGIATPLIAHWPAPVGVNPNYHGYRTGDFSREVPGGPLCHTPAHLIDIMATCVDIGGASYPTEFNGKTITPMEGKSLKNVFLGEGLAARSLFWEHHGNAAVRQGNMKLVRNGKNGPWELYDLKADRTELHDLASAQPGKTKELAAQWEAWAQRSHVKPYPAGSAGKAKKKGKRKASTTNK